jgi:hypothetical protein
MEASIPQAAPGRGLNIAAWVAGALGFLLYTVVASPPKLMSNPEAAEGFIRYGYTDGFRMFIGTCEFLGGIALLIPRLAFWAGCGLFIIMLGALYTTRTARRTNLGRGDRPPADGARVRAARASALPVVPISCS